MKQDKKYYSSKHDCLVQFKEKATSDFWDQQWTNSAQSIEKWIKTKKNYFYLSMVNKYIAKGCSVMDAGSGLCDKVYALEKADYAAYGLDFATKTLERVKEAIPNLRIFGGDVTNIPLSNESLDGYLSLGVIEHFWFGYDDILKEAYRVLKTGGYAFISCPYMSKFRIHKVKQSRYCTKVFSDHEPEGFYQFLLKQEDIIEKMESIGFKHLESKPFDGVKGLKDETNFANSLLNKIYSSPFLPLKVLKKLIDLFLRRNTAHSIMVVFKKI